MAIVATEISHVLGGLRRSIWYRCKDHLGEWHIYGPVMNAPESFDEEAFKSVAAYKVALMLEEREFELLLQEIE